MASVEDTCPEAIGLSKFGSTYFLSISLSIKSFITHPADLIISAPKLNKINSFKLGLLFEATIMQLGWAGVAKCPLAYAISLGKNSFSIFRSH